jgi:hypothetical protein
MAVSPESSNKTISKDRSITPEIVYKNENE